jgi:hypothetical protein
MDLSIMNYSIHYLCEIYRLILINDHRRAMLQNIYIPVKGNYFPV